MYFNTNGDEGNYQIKIPHENLLKIYGRMFEFIQSKRIKNI